MTKPKVILRCCPDYDPSRIAEGIEELGLSSKLRIKGCPPKQKTIVLWMFLRGRILNPLMRVELAFDSCFCLFLSWLRRIVKERL